MKTKILGIQVGTLASGVLKRSVWLVAERVVALSAALFVQILIARHLGPSDFGALNYVAAIVALLSPVANLGLNQIVSKALVDKGYTVGRVLGTVATLRGLGALATTSMITACLLYKPLQSDPLFFAAIVSGISIFGSVNFLQYWFSNENKIRFFAFASFVNTLVCALIRLILVLSEADILSFIVMLGVESAGLGLLCVAAYFLAGGKADWSFDKSISKHLLSRSWILIISGLAATVYMKIDTIMIANISGQAEAGVYSVAARLSEVWYFIPTLVMTALFPAMLSARGSDRGKYERMLQAAFDIMAAMATIVAILVTALGPVFIPWLFGDAYEGSVPILIVHVWSGIFVFMRAPLVNWIMAEDIMSITLMRTFIAMAVNVGLNLLLIPVWGGMGAAVATLIAYATAHYLSLVLDPRTRYMFRMMSLSLLWPFRIASIVRSVTVARVPSQSHDRFGK